MKGSRIHLDLLNVFSDLARERSFTKAAERNHLTPGAVTQQIAFLERHIGKKLVERNKKGCALTEEGQIFLEACGGISKIYLDALEKIRHPGETSGIVRVAAIYSIGLYRLPGYIRSFLRRHGRVDLRIDYVGAKEIYAGVLGDVYDLGILADPWPHPSIEIMQFAEERLAFVCSPEDALGKARIVHFRDLRGRKFIAFKSGIPTRGIVDSLLRKYGGWVDVVHEFDNIETLKRMVEIGAGVSILPENAVSQEVKNKTLCRIPLAKGPFFRPIGIVHKRKRNLSRATQEFIRWLLQ
jgi:DNA-binding transcriptional LysR family regulator